jgi:SAM-dependent MidA family methyltransferase
MKEESLETLAEYVNSALYGPTGYYTSGKVKFGPDFVTYAEKWAPYLADRFYLAWQTLGRLETFHIYEFGAGTGKMAHRILDYVLGRAELEPDSEWPKFYKSLKYIIGEISPELLKLQKEELKEYLLQNKVELYQSDARTVDDKLPRGPGIVVTNELIDNFPPQEITVTDEGLFATVVITRGNEIVLTPEEQKLVRTLTEKSQHLWTKSKSFYIQIGIEKYYEKLQSLLTQGYIFTLDYGFDGWHYLNQPEENKMLRTFSKKHGNGKNFLECFGELDITCDVNFSNLACIGKQFGCDVTYFGMQDSLGGPTISGFRMLIQNMGITNPECGKKLCAHMRESSPVYFEALASLSTLLTEGEKLFATLESATEARKIKTAFENFLNWLELNRYLYRDRAFMSNLSEKFSKILLKHTNLVWEIAEKNSMHAEILLTALIYHIQRIINEKNPEEFLLFAIEAKKAYELFIPMCYKKYPTITTKVINTENLKDYNFHQDSSENSLLNRCLATANKKLANLNTLAETAKKRGNQHVANKEHTAAIVCYEEALKYRPLFKEAFFNSGLCYKELDQKDKALICFKKAVEIDPNYVKALAQIKSLERQQMSNLPEEKNEKPGLDFNG